MTASELIDQIREAGGKLRVRDGQLYSKRIPEHLAGELKQWKPEIIRYLRLEAARDPFSATYRFPSCPGCGSYALYREWNTGNFECQTCRVKEITEARARRVE